MLGLIVWLFKLILFFRKFYHFFWLRRRLSLCPLINCSYLTVPQVFKSSGCYPIPLIAKPLCIWVPFLKWLNCVLSSDYRNFTVVIIFITTCSLECSLVNHLVFLNFFDLSISDKFKRIFESKYVQQSFILFCQVFSLYEFDIKLKHQLFIRFPVKLVGTRLLIVCI